MAEAKKNTNLPSSLSRRVLHIIYTVLNNEYIGEHNSVDVIKVDVVSRVSPRFCFENLVTFCFAKCPFLY